MEYKVRQGGLMRCCLASLDEAMEAATSPPEEGNTLRCKYCSNSMIFVNDAWQWDRPTVDMTDLAGLGERALQTTPQEIKEHLGIENASNFEEAVQQHMWGTRGPDNKQPLKHLRLIDADTDHLENILATQFQIWEITKRVILHILRNRQKSETYQHLLKPHEN